MRNRFINDGKNSKYLPIAFFLFIKDKDIVFFEQVNPWVWKIFLVQLLPLLLILKHQ